ncbi:sensor histidine kinase [Chitiniphilus eburneus]|uniref:histidine kinase n=1 Tax=Chitiniphilus eburneus TaxID=2571148 RepID=A0A4U0PDQ0_9NEIS|nr:ATP-binding protein [Chitiniphilus eburneus]TJZ65881.1 PAS domain-containing sensor histidine kinase [Chitiniphilus eburneus]
MAEHPPSLDPKELETAFSLFTMASAQLTEAYSELQQQVESLTRQLEITNGNLVRELEEKAALSRRLSLLLAHLPAGVLEVDGSGKVIAMNPAAHRLLFPLDEGMDWRAFTESHLEMDSATDLWSYSHSDVTLRLNLSEGQMPEESSRIVLVQDLTESWTLQQDLVRHKRLAAMGEMAAGLAHQLRTPLATALLYSANLTKPTLAENERIRFAEKTLMRLRHLESLIQNMLRFVRGQSLSQERFDAVGCVHEALQTMQPQLDAAGVTLHATLPKAGMEVVANRKELQGVILNLLDNGMHATPAGGTIAVTLAGDKGELVISVRDTGRGMSPEVQERLFEPFFTTRKDGTGLGLAIVQNLMSQFGGSVAVSSSPGQGSEFVLRLPLWVSPSNV